MNRRSEDARRNLSQWESLLSDSKESLEETRRLSESVRKSMEEIERVWDETASDVEEARRKTAEVTSKQKSDRESDAKFEEGEAAEPPPAVETEPSVHGDPDRPDEVKFEIPDPVTEQEVNSHIDSVKEKPPKSPERPEPFTEQSWFKLHSDQFPIGEEIFTEEALEPELEAADDGPDKKEKQPLQEDREKEGEGDTT